MNPPSRPPAHQRQTSENAVRREAVDIDPLASLLSAKPAPASQQSTTQSPYWQNAQPGHAQQRQAQQQHPLQQQQQMQQSQASQAGAAPVPPPVPQTDASYFADAFYAECRVTPLDFRNNIPNGVSGMQMCAKVRNWKRVIQISADVLQQKSGLELVATTSSSSPSLEASKPSKMLVISTALRLRLEGLFRLKMFDELLEEIFIALTTRNTSDGMSEKQQQALAAAHNVRMGILSHSNCVHMLSQTDFNTQMVLNNMLVEVRLLTGHGEDAMEELFLLRKQLRVDVHSIKAAGQGGESPVVAMEKYYWYWSVVGSIVNATCRQRQWRLAISEMTSMIQELISLRTLLLQSINITKNATDIAALNKIHEGLIAAEIVTRCRLSRLLLQIGALHSSSQCLASGVQILTSITHRTHAAAGTVHASSKTSFESLSAEDIDSILNGYVVEHVFSDSDAGATGSGAGPATANISSSGSLNIVTSHILVGIGLIYYCRNEYQDALNCFSHVLKKEKDRSNPTLSAGGGDGAADNKDPAAVFDKYNPAQRRSSGSSSSAYPPTTASIITFNSTQKLQFGLMEVTFNSLFNNANENIVMNETEHANNTNESLLATAVNNFAICSLHLKKIKEAVTCLEDLIKEDPSQFLIDPIVFNLCTMYDLTCAPDISVQKKKALQLIANYFFIEDPMLHWRCFRLANNS